MRYLYQPMSVMLEMLSTVFPIDDTSVGSPAQRERETEREREREREKQFISFLAAYHKHHQFQALTVPLNIITQHPNYKLIMDSICTIILTSKVIKSSCDDRE